METSEWRELVRPNRGDPLLVPPWTDPDWTDDGPAREKTNWPIRDPLMDRVRPALLPRDQSQNPTEYSKRFGIFPGRSDGRSRTSPTRVDNREAFVNGARSTGKAVFDYYAREADAQGQDLDDYLVDQKNDIDTFIHSKEDDRKKKLQDMIVDEYWQAARFGDTTTDELLAGNYFSMGETIYDLSGPLYPLLKQGYWATSKQWSPNEIETGHKLDGIETNFDARDPNVWAALQPALQLATRYLRLDDNVFRALLDVTHRCTLPVNPGPRPHVCPEGGTATTIKVHPHPAERLQCFPLLQSRPDFNPLANSIKILRNRLSIRVADVHARHPNIWVYNATPGLVQSRATQLGEPINLIIGAHVVWRLLSPKHSRAEKAAMSTFLGHIIAHEFMHAFECATQRWLEHPEEAGLHTAEDIYICQALRQELFPTNRHRAEPYFEDEHEAELGTVFDMHVLGNRLWLPSSVGCRPAATLDEGYSGFLARQKTLEVPDRAFKSGRDYRMMYSFLDLDTVSMRLQQSFWDNQVARYGAAVLRQALEKPTKVHFSEPATVEASWAIMKLPFGTEEDREYLANYVGDLQEAGRSSLVWYIKGLIQEAHQFHHLIHEFVKITGSWVEERNSNNLAADVSAMASEIISAVLIESGPAVHDLPAALAAQAEQWTMYTHNGSTEYADLAQLSRNVTLSMDDHEKRIMAKIMDYSATLEKERNLAESMLCDLYKLPGPYLELYHRALPGHMPVWKLRISTICQDIARITAQLDSLEGRFTLWEKEWRPRMTRFVWEFEKLMRLLDIEQVQTVRDWRDYLPTLSLMRKSRRTLRERWYFIASNEMKTLSPGEVSGVEAFHISFEHLINMAARPPIPPQDRQYMGIGQKWLGTLDSVIEHERRTLQTAPHGEAELRKYFATLKTQTEVDKQQRLKSAETFADGLLQQREDFRPGFQGSALEMLAWFGEDNSFMPAISPNESAASPKISAKVTGFDPGHSVPANQSFDQTVQEAEEDLEAFPEGGKPFTPDKSHNVEGFIDSPEEGPTETVTVSIKNHPTPLAETTWPTSLLEHHDSSTRRPHEPKGTPMNPRDAFGNSHHKKENDEPEVYVPGRVPTREVVMHEDVVKDLLDKARNRLEEQPKRRSVVRRAVHKVKKMLASKRQARSAAFEDVKEWRDVAERQAVLEKAIEDTAAAEGSGEHAIAGSNEVELDEDEDKMDEQLQQLLYGHLSPDELSEQMELDGKTAAGFDQDDIPGDRSDGDAFVRDHAMEVDSEPGEVSAFREDDSRGRKRTRGAGCQGRKPTKRVRFFE